jgi:hypothetical protein
MLVITNFQKITLIKDLINLISIIVFFHESDEIHFSIHEEDEEDEEDEDEEEYPPSEKMDISLKEDSLISFQQKKKEEEKEVLINICFK